MKMGMRVAGGSHPKGDEDRKGLHINFVWMLAKYCTQGNGSLHGSQNDNASYTYI